MDYLQPVLHLGQAGLAGYSLFHAYIAITNLRKFEEKTEKAAEWSTTAEHELHKTRTTQTSGTLAVRPGHQIIVESTNSCLDSLFLRHLSRPHLLLISIHLRQTSGQRSQHRCLCVHSGTHCKLLGAQGQSSICSRIQRCNHKHQCHQRATWISGFFMDSHQLGRGLASWARIDHIVHTSQHHLVVLGILFMSWAWKADVDSGNKLFDFARKPSRA